MLATERRGRRECEWEDNSYNNERNVGEEEVRESVRKTRERRQRRQRKERVSKIWRKEREQ